MRLLKNFTIILLMLFSMSAFAQYTTDENGNSIHDVDIVKRNLERMGKLDAFLEWQEQAKIRRQLGMNQNRSVNAVVTIPVVVHVLYDAAGSAQDVPDQHIFDMMETINTDFARTNTDANVTRAIFQGVASSVEIQFCLAQTDPNGNTTTGINRVQTNHGWFDPNGAGSEDMKTTATGGTDPWDQTRYLNVWVCDISNGAGAGVAGWAYFPGSHGQPEDGVVLDYDIGIGPGVGPNGPNRTLTHELGHYFGLPHTWGDGGCAVDDNFTDTPNSGSDNMSVQCGASPEPNTCDDGAGDLPDQYENYMSYATCQNMFTAEQAAEMENNLNTTRASLIGSNLCSTPILTAEFTPNTPGAAVVTIDAGQTVTFTDGSSGPNGITTWDWTFTGGTPATMNTQGPHVVTYNTPGTYQVSLTVGDGVGTDNKTVAALVEVSDVLNANFSADITYAALNEVITFTDLTSGPNAIVSHDWDFGDANVSTDVNPTHSYNTVGFKTVRLTVNDGTDTDTESKDMYIEVYDPNSLNIIDFVGIPTTININEDVNFEVETNQPDNIIDSIRWVFPGATDPFVYKTNTNPFDVEYSNGGVFDVEVRVYRDGGMDGDTLIKEDYITVIAPDSIPVANFTASTTNCPPGTFIDFTNLTPYLNQLDSVLWTFEINAGIYDTSTDIHPQDILFDFVGDFDVQLVVYSPFGNHDTLKLGYIHVFDPTNLNPIEANFEAVTPRLIQEGESVIFEDLSTGDIQYRQYSFDRGAGDAFITYSNDANPEQTFLEAGFYTVTLIARNDSYSDTIVKENYIVVTTTPWPHQEGYCDTLKALESYEVVPTYREAEYPSWGNFPGHYAKKTSETSSSKYIKRYAQKFESYTPDALSAILLPVAKAYDGDADAVISVRIWDADANGLPNEPISGTTKNKIKINSLQKRMYNYIELEEPVEVDSVFFVGFKLDYKTSTSPQDTFATYMAPERPDAEDNTLYVSRYSSGNNSGYWQTPSQFLEFELNTAMAIKVLGCVVNVPELAEIEASLSIYPNPAEDRLFVDFGEQIVHDLQIDVYDIVGKKVSSQLIDNYSSKYELDVSGNENGFYIVNIQVNGYKITKKILIQK